MSFKKAKKQDFVWVLVRASHIQILVDSLDSFNATSSEYILSETFGEQFGQHSYYTLP